MDSLIKKYHDRFWEERRLQYPHICLLYDLVGEMLRVAHLAPEKRQEEERRLHAVHSMRIGTMVISIEEAEELILRNTNQRLLMELDTTTGTTTVQELLVAYRHWLRALSHIVSDISKSYYLDIPVRHEKGYSSQVLKEL